MLTNWRVWLLIGAVILVTLMMFGCARVPQQQVEARICATNVATPIRVPDQECIDGKPGVIWLVGNDSLGPDDYTPIGEEVDDEYLGPDDPEVEHKSHKPTKKTETKKAKPTKAAKATKR